MIGVVPPGRVNKAYSICGTRINYTSGHSAARSACIRVRDILLEEPGNRFPVEKQRIWRSLGFLFNKKHCPDTDSPCEADIANIIDQTPHTTDDDADNPEAFLGLSTYFFRE